MRMDNHCGTCTACCQVFSIPPLNKKIGVWCQHCDIGKGCRIYQDRPKMCREFACLWLLSQTQEKSEARLGPELRPDRSKVVISPSTDHEVIYFTTMPGYPDAWRKPVFKTLLDRLVRGGLHALIGGPGSIFKIGLDKYGEQEVEMTPPDAEGMQYRIKPSNERAPANAS
jgi:hypothetical protein